MMSKSLSAASIALNRRMAIMNVINSKKNLLSDDECSALVEEDAEDDKL